ncbi:MAG: hypothetical protein HPM95_04640 [Alphaproteobacteria bacterium]|nr:hypothetical protein [Alphaproteobacteria bacterium]
MVDGDLGAGAAGARRRDDLAGSTRARPRYAPCWNSASCATRSRSEASQAIAGGDGITDRQVERWNDRLHEIGLRFAQSYAGASVMPDLDRFTPTD